MIPDLLINKQIQILNKSNENFPSSNRLNLHELFHKLLPKNNKSNIFIPNTDDIEPMLSACLVLDKILFLLWLRCDAQSISFSSYYLCFLQVIEVIPELSLLFIAESVRSHLFEDSIQQLCLRHMQVWSHVNRVSQYVT